MNNINKGFVKVEKFEAIQDKDGNWVPVGEVLETVEKQNALSTILLQRMTAQDNNRAGAFMGSSSTNFSSSSGDLTQPGTQYPQIFISEFPTASPGSLPGYRSSSSHTTLPKAPNRDGFGLYIGTFRTLDYDDRDSDESKTILTIKHRFDPDVSRERSIKAIGIANITSLNLGSPFIQTSSQILDVTYTIEIDLSDLNDPVFARREKMQRKQLSYPAGYINNDDLIPRNTLILPQSKVKAGSVQGFHKNYASTQPNSGSDLIPRHYQNSLDTTEIFKDPQGHHFNITNQLDGVYDLSTPTIDYTNATQKPGMLLGSIVTVQDPSYERNIHEWHSSKGTTYRASGDPTIWAFHSQQSVIDSASGSAIQNTFPRTAASTLPYQDVDALATGTGTIRITDSDVSGGSSWTANEDGLAKKYRINITTGGPTGTAEYTVEKRNWAGTGGNNHYPRIAPMLYTNYQNPSSSDSDGRGKVAMPFADDVTYDYHGQNPYKARSGTGGNFNDNILTARKMYKYPEFITYDRTGFTVMHMNQPGQNFETNFSDICQLVVHQNAARDIYVADKSTGLWKVERTVGQSESESTVTRLTASNAADDTVCRGVQVKNDGQIWAIFGEEMCSSSDGGSTWSVYNATTGTQFKLGNILDTSSSSSTPERVGGFTMDRYHSEDRFFIPLKGATELSHSDYTYYYYWWSRAGSASGTSDELYTSSGLNYTYQNLNLRSGDDAVWCSKGGVFYAAPPSASSQLKAGNFRSTTWYNQGYTWSSTYKSPVFGSKAHWWQDENGEEYVLGVSYTGSNTPAVAVRSDRFDSSDNTSSYSMFGGSLSGNANNPHEAKRMNDGYFSGDGDRFFGTTNQFMPTMLGLIEPGTAIVSNNAQYCAMSFTGSTTDSAGSPKIGDWTTYGWNGSSWVEGSTTPKTTHTSRDSLIDGLSIKFGGTDAGSWVSTEYFDTYAYNGILKDNATAFSVDLKQSYLDVDTTTDFESTVPTHTAGTVTEPVYLGLTQSNASYTTQKVTFWAEQGDWSIITSDDNISYSTIMRSEQEMQGDLSITFKLAEMNIYATQPQGVRIGLIDLHTNPSGQFQQNYHSDWMWLQYGGRPNTTDSAGDLELQFRQGSSSLQATVQLTDYDPSDVFKIERSNGNVIWYRNNVAIHTSNIVGDNEKVNFFVRKDEYGAGNIVLKDITATYIDSDGPCVTVGNGATTGASNADFRKIVENSTFRDVYNEIFIDGVPATINYDYSTPGAGECTVLPHSGKLRFDPTDAGATITGTIGYLKKF